MDETVTQDAHPTQGALLAVLASNMEQVKKDMAETRSDIKEMRRDMAETYARKEALKVLEDNQKMIEDSRKTLVSQEEFAPVKNLVYGMVGLILTSVLVALLSYIIIKK